MKRNLIQVVGALSIGALALTGCKSKGGDEGGKTGTEEAGKTENKCPGEGAKTGEKKCNGEGAKTAK
ncbi:MAG: hypothetical protein AB7N76_04060 [Planctomycetota bacterium]